MPNPPSILHILDHTTGSDALDTLSQLLERSPHNPPHVLILGHLLTRSLLESAGTPLAPLRAANRLHHIRSLGWADLSAWRALRSLVHSLQPDVLQLWGTASVLAATTANLPHRKCLYLTNAPSHAHAKLLKLCESKGNWQWVASSSTLVKHLAGLGLDPARITRIRPAISMARAKPPEGGPLPLKRALGITPDQGPILLVTGDGPNARHDFALWAAAILHQLFPHSRVLVREPLRDHSRGLNRLLHVLPDDNMTIVAPKELHWAQLAHAADIALLTPDSTAEVGGALYAMAAGIPVIGTPVECVGEILEHNHNGLLAKELKPRSIASRIEEYMADSTLKYRLTDHARAAIYDQFSPAKTTDEFHNLWNGQPLPVTTSLPTPLENATA